MARFYGEVQGNRKPVHRLGHSGLAVTAASWHGAIKVELYIDEQGRDCYRVIETPWHGAGLFSVIAEGVIGQQQELREAA